MDYFGEDEEVIRGKKWNWKNFESTKGYPVSNNLLDWVIGQERALKECYLCLEEWVHKLKNLKEEKWYEAWRKPDKEKPQITKTVPPGPYMLLLGDPGTGKTDDEDDDPYDKEFFPNDWIKAVVFFFLRKLIDGHVSRARIRFARMCRSPRPAVLSCRAECSPGRGNPSRYA